MTEPMNGVPAVCDRCGSVYDIANNLVSGGAAISIKNLTISNSSFGTCSQPGCGGRIWAVDGSYSLDRGVWRQLVGTVAESLRGRDRDELLELRQRVQRLEEDRNADEVDRLIRDLDLQKVERSTLAKMKEPANLIALLGLILQIVQILLGAGGGPSAPTQNPPLHLSLETPPPPAPPTPTSAPPTPPASPAAPAPEPGSTPPPTAPSAPSSASSPPLRQVLPPDHRKKRRGKRRSG